MKQLFTLIALLTAQTLSAQQYKPYSMRYDKTFFCTCEPMDSLDFWHYSVTDSIRAVYECMRSRPNNNKSHVPPPEHRTYYHLKTGSFYLENDK